MGLRSLIACLALLVALWVPAGAAAHGGLHPDGPHGGDRRAGAGISTLVLLGVPAALIAAGALGLRRAVRA